MLRNLFGKGAVGPLRPRAAERYQTVGLRCPLGDIVDLSSTGARVRFAASPDVEKGESFTLLVQSESQSVRVAARVAWMKRTGIRGGLMGVQFVNVRPGIAAALTQLGKYGFITADGSGTDAAASAPSDSVGRTSPPRAAIEIEDLYAMLGVDRTATDEAIKRSYHALALELHPDRNPSPDAAARFANAAKAYKVLRSPELRARYDALLARCVPATPRKVA
ncbi:MAG: hypothetical protein HBSAPP03_18570 [Phycisphaerae bacterium]|nr:MAG: hypothetical protein HBSAPP03_18570 [Phycisphaerae bacterium]